MTREDDVRKTSIKIGEFLRAKRESINKSQREIGERLGYRNVNFMSMLERGSSALPLLRISDIAKAYELSPVFAAIFVKALAPEVWEVCKVVRQIEKQHIESKLAGESDTDIDAYVDEIFKSALKEFRVKSK